VACLDRPGEAGVLKMNELPSVAVFLSGVAAFVLALISLAARHDLRALYWVALGTLALRASTEIMGSSGSR
jgi:hypothetical protein